MVKRLLLALVGVALASGDLLAAQDTLVASTTFLTARYTRSSGELALLVHDSSGRIVQRASVPGVTVNGSRRPLAAKLDVLGPRAIAVTWSARDRAAEHDFELALTSDDETAYYGTGERFHALNQRGYTIPVVSDDRYGNKGVGSYKPVPFFMSSRGFGVWVDTYMPGSFDLSATERFTSTLRFTDRHLRVVFFAGPAFADILDAFTALTGRTRVPPPWAFGLWKSRDVHHNQDSVYADIERLRQYKIPASVLVIDSPWETGYNTFDINEIQFPDAKRMFARIRALGFELCLWLTPFVNDSNVIDMKGILPFASTFAEAAKAGHLVKQRNGRVAASRWWKGRGGLVDFTNPKAIAWWHAQLRKTKAYGARAFKVDDGEGNFVPSAVFADGSRARAMKNRYSVLYDSVMQAYVDEELEGNGVLIARSGYTGMQRYPFAWAGDNRSSFAFDDGLPSVILSGQNAALSGIALWGSDIAGYAGRPDKEIFIRWTQFATFTPFMQVHMTSNLGPWDFDAETLEIFRAFASLRMRLFPYVYDAAHAAANTGLPIMRPMALAFQNDPEAARQIYQYLFGPDLLVAPVYQPGTHRVVYLPAGRWVDYWSRRVYDGPRVMEVEAPLSRIPLFVRAGAILPLLPDDVQTLVERHAELSPDVVALDDRRVLEVWPGGNGSVATWDGVRATVTVSDGQAALRLATTQPRPLEVRLNGRRIDPRVPGASVRYDKGTNQTRITFAMFSGDQTVEWTER
jgi:alpha-D-xyloside xylohydrolase